MGLWRRASIACGVIRLLKLFKISMRILFLHTEGDCYSVTGRRSVINDEDHAQIKDYTQTTIK